MDPFCYLCFISVMLTCVLLTALWLPAGKGLNSWLFCVWRFLCFVTLPIWCPGSGVIFDSIDSCSLPSFLLTFSLL